MTATVTEPLTNAELADTASVRVFVEADDLTRLANFETLRFRVGDRDFELHVGPRPSASDYSFRLTEAHLDSLRCADRVEFRRSWGRLTVEMTEETR